MSGLEHVIRSCVVRRNCLRSYVIRSQTGPSMAETRV